MTRFLDMPLDEQIAVVLFAAGWFVFLFIAIATGAWWLLPEALALGTLTFMVGWFFGRRRSGGPSED